MNGFDKDYGAKYLKTSKALKSTVSEREKYRDSSLMPLTANSYEEELLTARSAYDIGFFSRGFAKSSTNPLSLGRCTQFPPTRKRTQRSQG